MKLNRCTFNWLLGQAKYCLAALGLLCLSFRLAAQPTNALYENGFDKSAVGSVPEEFLVLNGQFAVREEGGNKFLELPGAPLETLGLLFGPTEKDDCAVSARIIGTSRGRLLPAFGVGLNGQGPSGYRLQVTPARKALELFKGDEVRASVPYTWASGTWTLFRLRVRKSGDGQWQVEGKAWAQESAEPAAWQVSIEEKEAPIAGRASVWGTPFSTTPIRFDDLRVTRVAEKPSN